MKKNMRKKFLAAAMALLMILSLTGCSVLLESREGTIWTRTLNEEEQTVIGSVVRPMLDGSSGRHLRNGCVWSGSFERSLSFGGSAVY